MTQVRVLADFTEEGASYRAGQVVDFASSAIITYRKAGGFVDDAAGAVSAAIAAGAPQLVHATEKIAAADAALGTVADLPVTNVTGTAYTLVPGDAHVCCKSGSATTVTVPADAVPIPMGKAISIEQDGAGTVTVAGAAGVTVNVISGKTPVIAGRYGVAQLIKKGANRWTLFGALA